MQRRDQPDDRPGRQSSSMTAPLISLDELQRSGRLRRFACDAMATTFELLILDQPADYARSAAARAFEEVDRLERLLSRYRPDSEVSQINLLNAGECIPVSVETIDCLELALAVSRDTGGAFDVTYASRSDASPPNLGAPPLVIDRAKRLVGTLRNDLHVDLGGIGKGYALDLMLPVLADWSISSALLHCGHSTMLAFGPPPAPPGWPITLRDPAAPPESPASLGRTSLIRGALSGSGRVLHGEHIRDPATGRPPDATFAAWARAPSAALADALSTAFMLMPPERIAAYCAAHADTAARVLVRHGDQLEMIHFGGDFPLDPPPAAPAT